MRSSPGTGGGVDISSGAKSGRRADGRSTGSIPGCGKVSLSETPNTPIYRHRLRQRHLPGLYPYGAMNLTSSTLCQTQVHPTTGVSQYSANGGNVARPVALSGASPGVPPPPPLRTHGGGPRAVSSPPPPRCRPRSTTRPRCTAASSPGHSAACCAWRHLLDGGRKRTFKTKQTK